MESLKKKDVIVLSLILFSFFFGAGNLIFPPHLGQISGTNTIKTMLGFGLTAIGLPVLGVIAVVKHGGLYELTSKVSKNFAKIFTIVLYLSIGPGVGIPRAGSVPFEMAIAPFLSPAIPKKMALFIYTLVFFAFAYILSLNPGKLLDKIGEILTPILLFLIMIAFIMSFTKSFKGYSDPVGAYKDQAFATGIVDGYKTMDAIAALNFGVVIASIIREKGIKNNNDILKYSKKVGIIASLLLLIVYSMLAYLGAKSTNIFGIMDNGALTLVNMMKYIFGNFGIIVLAMIFTLACLTTCVGLIMSCSQYFSKAFKYSYRQFVGIFTILSMLIANLGLTTILKVSSPILTAIYPIAIVLIILAILDDGGLDNIVYKYTVMFTSLFSIFLLLDELGLKLNTINKMPLYNMNMHWIIVALIGFIIGNMVVKLKVNNCSVD